MSDEYKDMAVRALQRLKGDDQARARFVFKDLTDVQMDQEYGESGETRRQVLDSYIESDRKIDRAIAWVEEARVD